MTWCAHADFGDQRWIGVILWYTFNGFEHPMVQKHTQAKSDHQKKHNLQYSSSGRKRSSKVFKQYEENEEQSKVQKFVR